MGGGIIIVKLSELLDDGANEFSDSHLLYHFCSTFFWLYEMKNVKNRPKIELKRGQKHKIDHIEEHNDVRVFNFSNM